MVVCMAGGLLEIGFSSACNGAARTTLQLDMPQMSAVAVLFPKACYPPSRMHARVAHACCYCPSSACLSDCHTPPVCRQLRHAVSTFIGLRRHEAMTLHQAVQGLRTRDMAWLPGSTLGGWREHVRWKQERLGDGKPAVATSTPGCRKFNANLMRSFDSHVHSTHLALIRRAVLTNIPTRSCTPPHPPFIPHPHLSCRARPCHPPLVARCAVALRAGTRVVAAGRGGGAAATRLLLRHRDGALQAAGLLLQVRLSPTSTASTSKL